MENEDRLDCTVTFPLDGELTPIVLAKAIIESDLLRGATFREFVDYLIVHVRHHCQHGLTNTEE